MSNDSPIASQSRRPRGLARVGIALALGVALGVAGTSLYVRHQRARAWRRLLRIPYRAARAEAMRQQRTQLRFTQGLLDAADGELVIERAARQELETQLRAPRPRSAVRDQLAFYEQLLPPGPEGSVDIRGAQVERGQGLRYKVLLMRSGRNGGAPFSGALRFQAVGTLKGRP